MLYRHISEVFQQKQKKKPINISKDLSLESRSCKICHIHVLHKPAFTASVMAWLSFKTDPGYSDETFGGSATETVCSFSIQY